MNKVDGLISYKQAMKYLGISSYTTLKTNYLDHGLPVINIGKSKRIDVQDIRSFVAKHRSDSTANQK